MIRGLIVFFAGCHFIRTKCLCKPVVNTQRAAASLFSFLMSYGRRSTLIDMEEGSFIFRTMTL
ncbi:hypothetical protein ABH892_000753 [Paenibacillus sp. RC254]